MSLTSLQKSRLRRAAYTGGFFLNVAVAFAAYVNSSFIEEFVGEKSVGLIYIIVALASIIISFNTDALIKKIGNRTALIFISIANILALLGLIFYRTTPAAIVFYIIYAVLNFLATINLDLYLEEVSDDRETGRIRGIFLTLANIAWLASPLLAGMVVDRMGYSAVYVVSGIALVPLAYLTIFELANVPREQFEHAGIYTTLKRLWGARSGYEVDIKNTIKLDFLLNFFYAIMIVYLPIYLHQYIGLGWDQIGIILTVALVPFVILDFFLGWLADTWLGEKELIITGILIAGSATTLLPLLTKPSVFWWAVILFMTRVGAATLEMMKEAYLFKKIDARDIDVIFISRNTSPLAYIIAPIIATIWLALFPFQYLFGALGLIVLLGLPAALKLKDTK